MKSCSECICYRCMYWWSGRYPNGGCFDDLRAKEDPYIKAHDGEIRSGWSRWKDPGEQDHWCRGGSFYSVNECSSFVEYEGQHVHGCFGCNVSVFQDGHIDCSLVNMIGCTECMKTYGGMNDGTDNL